MVAQRRDFIEPVAQHYDTRWLHFLDETGRRLPAATPYSPDISPLEQAWRKPKTALRTEQARRREALAQAEQAAVDWLSSQNAQHWFDHCGYYVQTA